MERFVREQPTVEQIGIREPDDLDRRLTRRDLVRWGPIVAGLVTTLATMLVLSVLGLAIGLSAFEPGDTGGTTYSTAAATWGAVSAVLAFVTGGWVAARTTAPGGIAVGLLNGFLVGAAAVALTIWLVGSGVGNLLGAAATNFGEIASVAFSADAATAYDEARTGAWSTFATLVVALSAGAAGGALGHRERRASERTRASDNG